MTDFEKRVSLFVCGDALLHESVYTDAMRKDGTFDFDAQLHHIRSVLPKYDLSFYNQETILGGTELGLSGYPFFNSPREFGDYMISSGFNLISTANNHSLDHGMPAIRNSRAFFNSQKHILMSGTNVSKAERFAIPSMEVNGIRIALLAWTEILNDLIPEEPYMVNYYPGHEAEMLAQIQQAKEENDAVILSLHWGTEYAEGPEETQMGLARRCMEAGADVIIGNHPHVVWPMETIHGKPVFYAMGNLISSQIEIENRIGLVAEMDLVLREQDGKRSLSVEEIHGDFHYTKLKGEYPELRTDIEVIPFSCLNDEILPGYRSILRSFMERVTSFGGPIRIGGIFPKGETAHGNQ